MSRFTSALKGSENPLWGFAVALGVLLAGALIIGLMIVLSALLGRGNVVIEFLNDVLGFGALLVFPITLVIAFVVQWRCARNGPPLAAVFIRLSIAIVMLIIVNSTLPYINVFLVMFASDGGDPMRSVPTAIAAGMFYLFYYGLMLANYVLFPGLLLWSSVRIWKLSAASSQKIKTILRGGIIILATLTLCYGAFVAYYALKESYYRARIETEGISDELCRGVMNNKYAIAAKTTCAIDNQRLAYEKTMQGREEQKAELKNNAYSRDVLEKSLEGQNVPAGWDMWLYNESYNYCVRQFVTLAQQQGVDSTLLLTEKKADVIKCGHLRYIAQRFCERPLYNKAKARWKNPNDYIAERTYEINQCTRAEFKRLAESATPLEDLIRNEPDTDQKNKN